MSFIYRVLLQSLILFHHRLLFLHHLNLLLLTFSISSISFLFILIFILSISIFFTTHYSPLTPLPLSPLLTTHPSPLTPPLQAWTVPVWGTKILKQQQQATSSLEDSNAPMKRSSQSSLIRSYHITSCHIISCSFLSYTTVIHSCFSCFYLILI